MPADQPENVVCRSITATKLDASFDRLLLESEDEVDILGEVDEAVVPAVWNSDDEIDEDYEVSVAKQEVCTEWAATIRASNNINFSDDYGASRIGPQETNVQILDSLDFVDNSNADESNRLNKIDAVVKILNQTFAEVYKPGREVCIDESMVPFRGRVLFRQYLRGKRYKCSLKLYKLC
ncbi:hypothetical protein ANCDUO_06526 [Ancylostoma duodenale]|uniref:PiggyBac transposable element-derived protein domain-containing protein n=1 Tax=Ancylostoma duodenale TaxID=51022 RepID=A0A0C2D1E3_9BILA|nr:hypothetical protein ANCDUO_06526 [Ancylostoma duodenale]